MKLDIAILVINILITFLSGLGAFNSLRYFKKSKHITIYAQTNKSLGVLDEMIKILPEVLAAARNTKRGFSSENAVRDIGLKLQSHLNEIMHSMPSEYMTEFRQKQKTSTFDLEKYISSLIDGEEIVVSKDGARIGRDRFDACQERLRVLQEYLKEKISNEAEKLK